MTEPYQLCMQQLRERFGEDAGFVLASDEANMRLGSTASVIIGAPYGVGPGHHTEFFAELSLCDYIVSVPSTFSAWAAFFGCKPLLAIDPSDDNWIRAPLMNENLLDAHKDALYRAAVN